ncbi:MAG: hypothetical protein HY300_13455, partial [Verrucomicrobia bacterium]|nr:hypothetical protein [Verrucomicrobiota bacterium]
MITARRRMTRIVWSAVAFGFLPASYIGIADEKLATKLVGERKPKPKKSSDDGAPRDPNAPKPYQVITDGPPPASPAEFSPDFGARMFQSPLFAAPELKLQLNVRTIFTRLQPGFNPDLNPSPKFPPWLRDGEELRLRTRRTVAPPPKPPAQFNPDPGAWATNALPANEPFFRNEANLTQPDFGSAPVPKPLELPRLRLRVNTLTLEPEPPATGYGYGSVPLGFATQRQRTRVNMLTLGPETPPPSYGSEPLPKALELPRVNTRQMLRIDDRLHPHDHPDPGDYRLPDASEPRPDRWRIPFAHWKRYPFSDVESPYYYDKPAWWHPYRQSVLKGDLPLFGEDIFLNLTVSSSTEYEAKTLPIPSGVSAADAGAAEFFGHSEVQSVQQNFSFSVELFKGETAFKPVEWAVRLTPVYNINYVHAVETGVVSPDPRGLLGGGNSALNTTPPTNGGVQNPGDVDTLLNGQVSPTGSSLAGSRSTVRTRDFWTLQEWFGELHLRDLSDNYDFMAMRGGNQTFNSDFRGFLFNDTNLGLRLFGNANNNRYQYNLVGFEMREKDTNSELNTFNARNQQVLIANLYKQDFLWHGYTAEWSMHFNNDEATVHYD